MMQYDRVLEHDSMVCRADSLQSLIEAFDKLPHHPETYFYHIVRVNDAH